MQSLLTTPLNSVSQALDGLARFGRHRFVKEKNVGIAYGEQMLKNMISLLDVDMVFDVGANVGQYVRQLRGNVGYEGCIVSFEPLPSAARRLRSLAQNDGQWTVHECAIDEVAGKATFNVMAGDQFSSLLSPSQEYEGHFHGQHKVTQTIDVDVVSLCDAVGKVDVFKRGLLKLDTQGTELRILRGGKDCLWGFSAIQMEVGFKSLYEGESSFNEVVQTLNTWGYEICALFPNNHGHFPHLLEMDAIFLRRELFPPLP